MFRPWLRRIGGRASKPAPRGGRRPKARLWLEGLEDRCLLSGSVSITALQGPLTTSATVPAASEGTLASPSLNAAFTDTNALLPNQLTVTINYGDGTPVSTNQGAGADPNLIITEVGGAGGTTYTVTDTHTFPEESGSTVPPFAFTVTMAVTENANAANTDTATTQAQVLDAALAPGNPVNPGSPTVFTGGDTGDSTSAGQALANFEAAIGGVKNTAAAPQVGGFRTITWDAVKVDGTDAVAGPHSTTVITSGHTVGIPLDRFQGQGVFFGAVYAVSNDGFVDVNPNVGSPNPVLFPAFSPPSIFAMFNDNGIDFKFVAASSPTTPPVSATSSGFGSIFLNVQQPGTTIQFFHGSTVLETLNVPTNSTPGAAVFAGDLFSSPIVTNVLLTLGQGVIFKFDGTTVTAGGADSATNNLVAVDNWVFAEPVPSANGFPIVSGGAGTTNAAVNVNATESMAFTGVVATFSDADPNANAKDYTATINWGDGHFSNASIAANASGGFDVSGTNTYANAGTFPINVDIQDFGGGPGVGGSQSTFSFNNTAKVADAPLTVTGTQVTVPQGVLANNVTVATFTDAAGATSVSTFTATINWGDGTGLDAGTISLAGGTFTVTGTHVYSAPGRFTVTVTILDVGGGTASAKSTAVIGTVNERFVAQVYLDLLQRRVDPGGLASWLGLLNQGTSANQVVLDIEQSQEYFTVVVQGLYKQFLHRGADPGGLNMFVGVLSGGGTDEQVAAALVGSPEYFQNRGGGTNDGFLTALYQDALNRGVDAGGRASFDQFLAKGGTTGQVAAMIFGSPEYKQDLVSGFYQLILRRKADSDGLNAFAGALQSGKRDEDVIAALASSPEFFSDL